MTWDESLGNFIITEKRTGFTASVYDPEPDSWLLRNSDWTVELFGLIRLQGYDPDKISQELYDELASMFNERTFVVSSPNGAARELKLDVHRPISQQERHEILRTLGFLIDKNEYYPRTDMCFAAGTAIRMGDGTTKAIESITEGDLVMAFTGRENPVPRRVQATFKNSSARFIQLENAVRVTPEHPFLTEDGRFVPIADAIKLGLRVVSEDGTLVLAAGCEQELQTPEETYNFTVEHLHTYIAGGFRVHNLSILHFAEEGEIVLKQGWLPDGSQYSLSLSPENVIVKRIGRSNIDSDPDTDLLLVEKTYVSSGASIKETWTEFDSDDKRLGRASYEVKWKNEIIDGERLGLILGPQLIGILGINDPLARLAANTISVTVLSNAFELITDLGHSIFRDIRLPDGFENVSDFLLEKSFGDFSSDLSKNFQNQSSSTIASLLVAEAAERLNLNGFKGQLFTTTGNTIGDQLARNIFDAVVNNKEITEAQLLIGFERLKLLSSIGNALGSVLAAKLGNNLKIESVGEALSSTISGMYGGLAGVQVVGDIAAGSSIAGGFITTVANAVLGKSLTSALGAIILPGIGSLLGTIAGQAIGSKVFDFVDKISGGFFSGLFAKSVWHYQYVNYDAQTNSFVRGHDGSKNTTSQLRNGTYSITDAFLESLNEIVRTIGGTIDAAKYQDASDNALFAYVGREAPWDGRDDWRVVFGGGNNYVNSGGDVARIVRIAIEHQLSKLSFSSGDPLKLQALEAWKLELSEFKERSGDSLSSLMAKLQLAEDVRRYEDNVVLVNSLIKANPDSTMALSWIATLMQWEGINAKAADTLINNAQKSFDMGDVDGGIYQLARSLEFAPKRTETLLDLGEKYFAQGDLNSAINSLQRFASVTTTNANAWLILGKAFIQRNEGTDHQDGIYALERSVEIDHRSGEAFGVLAKAYYDSGDIAKARTTLARARQFGTHVDMSMLPNAWIEINAGFVVGRGAINVISNSALLVTDTKRPASELIFTLTSVPVHGALQRSVNGIWTPLAVAGEFTQQDINDGFVRYGHDGGLDLEDHFDFAVSDGVSVSRSLKRVSVNASLNQGNADSISPSISTDGRFVAFLSDASNFVPGDTNHTDVFLLDRLSQQISRISVDPMGNQTDYSSASPAISANGRFVAFASDGTTLVPGDTNTSSDIFVYDHSTTHLSRVSVNSQGVQGDHSSTSPAISADGRYVTFSSGATNLVPGDTNNSTDIFVYDRETNKIERVSGSSAGVQGDGNSSDPSISADGRFVTYQSSAHNLVPNDPSTDFQIFLYDRQTAQTSRISVGTNGVPGNRNSYEPSISANGQFIAYRSQSYNLVPNDTNNDYDIFLYDRFTGRTQRISVDSSGNQANGNSYYPSISADGRFVTYQSSAHNLVPNDTSTDFQVFLFDRQTAQTSRISVGTNGVHGNRNSYEPSISGDGRFIALRSQSYNLDPNDTNGFDDIFVVDRGVSFLSQSARVNMPINQPPAALTLSASTLAENQPRDAIIGELRASDPNPGETFVYTLVSGIGSNDNAVFTVDSSGNLRSKLSLNFEFQSSYSIRARSTDQGGLFKEAVFTVSVTNVNESPIINNQTLSALSESSVSGAVVGRVKAWDPDAGQVTDFAITGGNTGGAFVINPSTGQITVANPSALDFETKPIYDLTVQVAENGTPGLKTSAIVTVNLLNQFEITGSALQAIVPLYQYPLSAPGTLNDWWQRILVAATPDRPVTVIINPNNGPFDPALGGDDYRNYLTGLSMLRGNPSVRILGYVATGFGTTPPATILQHAGWYANGYKHNLTSASLIDGIFLDQMSSNAAHVAGYSTVAKKIRALSGLASHFIAGNPGTTIPEEYLNAKAADLFVVRAGSIADLFANPAPAYVTAPAYKKLTFGAIVHSVAGIGELADSLRQFKLRGFDYGFVTDYMAPNAYDQSPSFFLDYLRDIHAPYFYSPKPVRIPENSANGTVVLRILARDPDPRQSLIYTITGGNIGGAFAINSTTGVLTVNTTSLDYESLRSYLLTIQVIDNGNPALSGSATVTVNVTDVKEAPTNLTLSKTAIAENQPRRTTVGVFSKTDPDVRDVSVYTLVSGVGSADNANFTIDAHGNLKTAAVFDFETRRSFSIRVRTTDRGGLFFERAFTITVTDVLEVPEINVLDGATNVANGSSVSLGTASQNGPVLTKTFRVQNTGTAHLLLQPIKVSGVGYRLSGANFTANQIVAANASVTITVRLSTASAGTFIGSVSFVNSDGNENPYDIALSGAINPAGPAKLFIYNRDPRFATVSSRSNVIRYGYGNNAKAATGSNGTRKATSTFIELTAGQYHIEATLLPVRDRANNGLYNFKDGTGKVLGSRWLNQRLNPTGATAAESRTFKTLTTITIMADQLIVELVNQGTNGAIIADSMRFEKIGRGA